MAPAAPPLLSLQGLRKRYSPRAPWALNGVSLEVSEGDFVVVLGSSGAGKSTLIRCINLLVLPTEGTVRWQGQDVLGLTPPQLRAYRRNIGMIFQEFHLIDRLNVLDNVLVGRFGAIAPWRAVLGRYSASDLDIAWESLRRVGLEAYAYRRASELSGGQRQRVAIARALTQRPRLILGDEPVSNLDPVTSRFILNLLAEINARDGITLIINLHSVELARRYARRILGMAAGRIVFDGPPAALDGDALRAIYGSQADEGESEPSPVPVPTDATAP